MRTEIRVSRMSRRLRVSRGEGGCSMRRHVRIEVKGSRVTFEGKPALIAAEVRKGDEVLKLRDEAGMPLWSGWRRK
jgi:hypothetical protein